MDKQTTIQTLTRLDSLISAKKELDGPASDDINSQARKNLRSIREKYFGCYGVSHPSLARDTLNVFYKEKPIPYSLIAYVGLGIAIISICFLPQIIGWTAYFIFLAFVVIALAFIAILIPKDGIKKRIIGDAVAEYKKVKASLNCYEQEVQYGVQELAERKAKYPEAFTECLQEIERAEARKDELRNEINNYNTEISNINLIPSEYYHLIDDVIKYLQSGRTDDYKEALNIAIKEEIKKEHEAEQRQAEERARQERESLGMAKCNHCQNRWSCPKEIQKSGAGLTCGGYKPYGT